MINNLEKLGCNKLRICNPQLMGYISKNYPYIELYLSTSSEIKTIKDYSAFIYSSFNSSISSKSIVSPFF